MLASGSSQVIRTVVGNKNKCSWDLVLFSILLGNYVVVIVIVAVVAAVCVIC